MRGDLSAKQWMRPKAGGFGPAGEKISMQFFPAMVTLF
jgi:hypothetical protein